MDKGRNGRIASLRTQGHSIRAIARQVGLSRSRVHEIVSALPDDGDPDPWTDDGDGDGLALFDTTEDTWPPEPFTFVGREREWLPGAKGEGGRWVLVDRWVDGDGRSLKEPTESAAMKLYRYRQYLRCELDDPARADALDADLARQRAEWERKHGVSTP